MKFPERQISTLYIIQVFAGKVKRFFDFLQILHIDQL